MCQRPVHESCWIGGSGLYGVRQVAYPGVNSGGQGEYMYVSQYFTWDNGYPLGNSPQYLTCSLFFCMAKIEGMSVFRLLLAGAVLGEV